MAQPISTLTNGMMSLPHSNPNNLAQIQANLDKVNRNVQLVYAQNNLILQYVQNLAARPCPVSATELIQSGSPEIPSSTSLDPQDHSEGSKSQLSTAVINHDQNTQRSVSVGENGAMSSSLDGLQNLVERTSASKRRRPNSLESVTNGDFSNTQYKQRTPSPASVSPSEYSNSASFPTVPTVKVEDSGVMHTAPLISMEDRGDSQPAFQCNYDSPCILAPPLNSQQSCFSAIVKEDRVHVPGDATEHSCDYRYVPPAEYHEKEYLPAEIVRKFYNSFPDSPTRFALRLFQAVFTDVSELVGRNVSGLMGRDPLDKNKIGYIRRLQVKFYPNWDHVFVWRNSRTLIDSVSRNIQLQVRNKGRVYRYDPKEYHLKLRPIKPARKKTKASSVEQQP